MTNLFDDTDDTQGQQGQQGQQGPQGQIVAPAVAGIKDAGPTAAAVHMSVTVERVEVECVIGGALQRVVLRNVAPHKTLEYLRGLDPGVKVREDFPSKGFGGGNRETKMGRILTIQVRATDSGLFWSLVVSGPDGDVTVEVSKKQAGGFLDAVKALNKLDDANVAKLSDAIGAKKQAVVVVAVEMGVKYWSTDDGKHFVDSVVAEVPATEVAKDK